MHMQNLNFEQQYFFMLCCFCAFVLKPSNRITHLSWSNLSSHRHRFIMMTTDIDPGTATTTTNSMNRGRGIVNMDRRKSKKRRENLSAISELSCNDVVVSPYEIATSPSVCGTEITDKNEQELMIEIYSPSDTIISPLTCSIQSSLSSSSSSLFLPNDGAMSTLSKGSLETTQNEDEMEEIHPEVDIIDQISKTPAGEQAHAKNEENISTIFLTADRLEKGKSFVNFQRPRRKPLRDRSDIFQTLNNQDVDINPRMEFHHELSPGVIVPGSIALSPLHSQNNANTCRQEEHNGFQSSDDTIEDGFCLWDNSSPDFHQKKITTLNSQRFSCPTNELRIEKKTNNCSSDVVNISQWTETNNSPSNIAIFIPMKGRKGRRLSSCYSLPLVNIEDDLNRIKSNNTTSRLTNIFEDEPVLTTLLEESHQSCDERGKHNQEQLDYVSTKNRKILHCVSLADYKKRISPFRNVFEEMRLLRNENKRLNDENRYVAYTLQNQMTTTMTAALKKKQELERELIVAHKTISNLSEKVKVLEGTHY